ncbi:MAG: GvpL/GvpF family gas vesicle protein [Gemmatimonadota bacterium]|nr:GvpL/GvpF family gas vesicle protein [Gemmatimonadota bacterium]
MEEHGAAEEGLRLLGVVHAERRRTPLWETSGRAPAEGETVRYRDLAALVYPGPLRDARLDPERVLDHHHRLDTLLRRATVVPAPYGLAFREPREVARFIRASYVPLADALVLVEGRWEFRVHISPAHPDLAEALGLDLATHVYAELRRISHSAIPFPQPESRVLSAAFLVDRLETRPFLDRVEALGDTTPDLSLDVTGPWPPYDFVMVRNEEP